METNIARQTLYQQLMNVPHREYGKVVSQLNNALTSDPDFISKAMVYTFANSAIRDQQDAALIVLLQSLPEMGYREAGRALFGLDFYKTEYTDGMKALDPYRLLRIERYLRGREIVIVEKAYKGKTYKQFKEIKRQTPGPYPRRTIETLMRDYLSYLADRPKRLEGVLLHNLAEIKSVTKTYHIILPQPWFDIVEGKPPVGTVFYEIKQIASEPDIEARAKLVIEYGIPYRKAISLLPKSHISSHIALIDVMTPAEAANNIHWAEESGVLNIPEVAAAFTAKVKLAKSVASTTHRKSSQAKTKEVQEALVVAQDVATARKRRITKRTLLEVDISSSMEPVIEPAIEFAANVGALIDDPGNLMIVLFKDYAQVLKPKDLSLSSLRQEFRNIRVGGSTSIGSGLQLALSGGFEPEQVVIMTDGQENREPRYRNVLRERGDLHTVIMGVGNYDAAFSSEIDSAGFRQDTFKFTGDYYLFDQISALLSGPRGKSLVEQILEIEMPRVIR